MLLSIDPTLGYKEIENMKQEAITLRALTKTKQLHVWLTQFILECSAWLPTHKCWIEKEEDGEKVKHIVLESLDNGWKYILIHIEFEYDQEELEEICYACVKRYELKDQIEPKSYNQSEPGLYVRYPYLCKVKVSHETWLQLTKLWCHQYQINNKEREDSR
jgi:hypothetical protein